MEISKKTVQAVQEPCHISDEIKEIRVLLTKLVNIFIDNSYSNTPKNLANHLEFKGKKPQTSNTTL